MTIQRRDLESSQRPGAQALRAPAPAALLTGLLLACLVAFLFSFALALPASAQTELTPSPRGAEVYIISPANGDVVTGPFTVRFGLKGMGVAPAGVDKPGTGHHHLVIDSTVVSMNTPLPNNESHRHFGGGQTEVTIELAPGPHTLQLVLADYRHIPHDPPLLSEPIQITVSAAAPGVPGPPLLH